MGSTDSGSSLLSCPLQGERPGRPGCAPRSWERGGRGGLEEEPRRGGNKLPGRWVIYGVLKSIFEAVIYLTALSLNKHRIRLIIVTVETQHPNLVAIAASPSPAGLRPGLRISSQLHPSGCLGSKAPDLQRGRPGLASLQVVLISIPTPFPFSLSHAHSCIHECTSLQIICQEQRLHLPPAGNLHWLDLFGSTREDPWPGSPHSFPVLGAFLGCGHLIQPGPGDSCKVKGTLSLWLTRLGKAEGQGRVLGKERRKCFLFLSDFVFSKGEGKGSSCLIISINVPRLELGICFLFGMWEASCLWKLFCPRCQSREADASTATRMVTSQGHSG